MRSAALVFLAALAAAPASAQETSPYQALAAELANPEMFELAFRRMVDVDMRAVFLADPDIDAFEQECPGAIEALLTAATPLINELNDEGLVEYREALHGFLPTRISADDARLAADFFASDLGRRFIRTVSAETGFRNSLESGMSNDEGLIDRSAFERDQLAAARDGIAALSVADLQAVTQAFGTTSWGRTFAALGPEITDLKYRIVNADFTPEQDAALENMMTDTVNAHADACYEQGDTDKYTNK